MNNIYETLRKHGLTTSQRDFSRRWAGRSPSYLATMNTPSERVMIAVLRKLIAERRWLLALRVAHMMLVDPHRRPA
jgi:hypothetical protein